MEYTKNYHLPQWVKEDRILMEDFNRMCADIEAGLTGVRETAGRESETLAEQLTDLRKESTSRDDQILAEGKSDLQKGLFRLAHNQCAHLLELDEAPALDGIFHQPLTMEEAPANTSNIYVHQDGMWCASSGSGGTIEAVQKAIKVVSPLVLVKDDPAASQTGIFTIEPIGAVCIERLDPSGSYTGNTDRRDARFHIRLVNLSRDVVEMETETGGGLGRGTYGVHLELEMYAYLHGGDKYQLEVTVLETPISGTFGYEVGNGMRLEYYGQIEDNTTGTLTHTFDKGETGFGGLVLARYAAYNKGGVLTAVWGGQEKTPFCTRTFTDSKGREVTEAEFRFTDPIPANSTVTLKATVPPCGDIVLHNWCAALL